MNKKKFFQIYTGDYTNIGYHDGIEDGKQGKPKSHFGILTQRHWMNYIIHFNKSGQTYSSGYNNGHEDGLRIHENIYHERIPLQQGVTMSNLERYDRVLAGLTTAKNGIKSNISQLESALTHYDRQIEAMQSIGFLEDYTKQLKAYNGLNTRINGLKQVLEQVIRKIADIETNIRALKADAEKKPE